MGAAPSPCTAVAGHAYRGQIYPRQAQGLVIRLPLDVLASFASDMPYLDWVKLKVISSRVTVGSRSAVAPPRRLPREQLQCDATSVSVSGLGYEANREGSLFKPMDHTQSGESPEHSPRLCSNLQYPELPA